MSYLREGKRRDTVIFGRAGEGWLCCIWEHWRWEIMLCLGEPERGDIVLFGRTGEGRYFPVIISTSGEGRYGWKISQVKGRKCHC